MTEVNVEIHTTEVEGPQVFPTPDSPGITIEPTPAVESVEIVQSGPAGPKGDPGPGADFYEHPQPVAEDVWEIPHGLGYFPMVWSWDQFGRRIRGGPENVDENLLRLHFSIPYAGSALLK